MKRYQVLDSWRGVAALGVFVYHAHLHFGIRNAEFLGGFYMFVDFFFVLSGFVISAAYNRKLENGFGFWNFMWLRVGRIYPLHLFTLLALILVHVATKHPDSETWFQAPERSWDTIIANLLLIHGLNLYDFLTWNRPSWSISTEFATYVLYALVMCNFGKHRVATCFIAVSLAPAYLFLFNHGKYLDATAMNGIVRCIYGFAMGVLVEAFLARWTDKMTSLAERRYFATMAETAIFLLAACYLAMAGTGLLSLAAPLVFSLVVIVFSAEAGLISRLLRTRPFIGIGLLSYSIYMVHSIMLGIWVRLAPVAAPRLGKAGVMFEVSGLSENDVPMTGANYGGFFLLFLLVLAASLFTYRFVEEPARRKSRAWINRAAGARSSGSPGAVG